MKKLFMMALMVLSATSMFAGDSAPLKTILSAKTYAEAEAALKANLSQLVNDAEKAKAYNKLVDLAMAKVSKEDEERAKAQISGTTANVDEEGQYLALYNAVVNAIECEKYDVLPNEKGKVAPKFHKKNQDRLYPRRVDLINGGVFYQDKGDSEKQYQFLDLYVESASEPLFKDVANADDPNLGNIAFYSSYNALLKKDYDKAERYASMALNDSVNGDNAYTVLLSSMQAQLNSRQDSLDYVKKVEGMYAQSKNGRLFDSLCGAYSAMDKTDELKQLIASRLAEDPNDWTALAYRGQMFQTEKKWDDAIKDFELARKSEPENVFLSAALGISYMGKAGEVEEKMADANGNLSKDAVAARDAELMKAIENFEKAKELDVREEQVRSWSYNLYRCYFIVYGEDDPRTKSMEAMQ